MEDDLSWEDDELTHMLSSQSRPEIRPEMSPFRRGAVDLVLELHGHCGFSSITAVLAVDYLDRFLSSGCTSQQNTAPWQGHLTAAVCLSLAAKVVETAVPLLPDLQGDEGAYFFDAKTMKRMELLVLSRLKWRMNPVTPLSFLDHISRRLHFRDPRLCGEFLRMYECLLLSVLSDIGLLQFPPSVVAAATTLQVIGGLENAGLGEECLSDLLGILANDRLENLESCRQLISEHVSTAAAGTLGPLPRPNKWNHLRGVVGCACLRSDSCNDSSEVVPLPSIPSPAAVPFTKDHCL